MLYGTKVAGWCQKLATGAVAPGESWYTCLQSTVTQEADTGACSVTKAAGWYKGPLRKQYSGTLCQHVRCPGGARAS